MPPNPKYDIDGEITRPTIELRPWVRGLHAWLKATNGGRRRSNRPPTSLASSSRRGLSQQEAAAGPDDEANASLSDSSDSFGSSSGGPREASTGKIAQKSISPRSAPTEGLKAGPRPPRSSPWRRYLENVVEAKIREHFEAQIRGEMRTREEHDDAKKKNRNIKRKDMEGEEGNEVEQDLETGLHQAYVDPTVEAVSQSDERSIPGEVGSWSLAEDVTENDQALVNRGVEVLNRWGEDDDFRKAKLRNKNHGKKKKYSKKGGLAQEVLNWLVFDGPSSSKQPQKGRYEPHSRSRGDHDDPEAGMEKGKRKGKQREQATDDEAPPKDEDAAWNSPSQPPFPHHARHGRQMNRHGVRAVTVLHSPRVKTSLVRDLARWILGSPAPAQKHQGRHLSYATTHGTSMQRVERLLRQGLEVERGLETTYDDLPGKKGKGTGEKPATESTKVKIGRMVLRFLIGEGERGIRDAEGNERGEDEDEIRRGRSRVRDEDFDERRNTSQGTGKRNEGQRSDQNFGAELLRSPSAISALHSRSHHSLTPLASIMPSTSSTAGERTSLPIHHAEGKKKEFHLPSPTDSESSV